MSKLKCIITLDLGYGDSGKGTIVDALVQQHNAKLVARYNGGFQAAHNVHQGDVHHTFAQFGSGTLSGAKTLLGPKVIVNPLSMQVEANLLKTKGISNPMDLMYVSSSCIITTPYHRALNQVRELSRVRNHGSTGCGIGETKRMAALCGSLTLRARDLRDGNFVQKLANIEEECYLRCYELIHDYFRDPMITAEIMDMFTFDQRKTLIERYTEWAKQVKILGALELAALIITNGRPLIMEAAQGFLLDQLHGFHPYTTWSNTSCAHAYELLKYDDDMIGDAPSKWDTEVIGITRTFATRHGAGPLLTESSDCTPLLADDDNPHGQFQGSMRAGYLDLMTLKYALKHNKVDGLALTHCDKLVTGLPSQVCVGYKGADLLSYNCLVEAGCEALNFTQAYLKSEPVYQDVVDLPAFLEKELAVPVVISSYNKQTKGKQFYGTNINR